MGINQLKLSQSILSLLVIAIIFSFIIPQAFADHPELYITAKTDSKVKTPGYSWRKFFWAA